MDNSGAVKDGRGGITIGHGVVIGAGSIVLNDVPDYKVVAGNPACTVADRRDNQANLYD